MYHSELWSDVFYLYCDVYPSKLCLCIRNFYMLMREIFGQTDKKVMKESKILVNMTDKKVMKESKILVNMTAILRYFKIT